MAGEALQIVVSTVVLESLVRIVAGHATDAGIIADETLAERQAVGLEADKGGSVPAIAHDGVKGAMTLSTEARNLFSVEMLERWRKRLEVVACGIGHVLLRTGVAVFAAKSGNDLRSIEFVADAGSVTVEAGARLPDWKAPPHRLLNGVRCDSLISRCCSERAVAREVAYEALVEMTVLLEDPCLRVLTKDPVDGESDGTGSVGDGIRAAAIPSLNGVSVWAECDGEVGTGGEQWVCAIRFHGVAHWSGSERVGDSGVASCAGRSWSLLGACLRGRRW